MEILSTRLITIMIVSQENVKKGLLMIRRNTKTYKILIKDGWKGLKQNGISETGGVGEPVFVTEQYNFLMLNADRYTNRNTFFFCHSIICMETRED